MFNDDLDEIVGIIYAKDVLKALHQGKHDMPLSDIRKAHFVPESKKVADPARDAAREVPHRARDRRVRERRGLVTLEDLLEELGEIADEYDTEEPDVEVVSEDVYRVDGKLAIDELNEILDAELPDEEWDTIGGLCSGCSARSPTRDRT